MSVSLQTVRERLQQLQGQVVNVTTSSLTPMTLTTVIPSPEGQGVLTLIGTNFSPYCSVFISDGSMGNAFNASSVAFIDDTQLQAVFTPGPSGPYTVTVIRADATRVTKAG